MIKERKCLEIYLDSNKNGSKEIQKQIKQARKDFPNKKIDARISLNEYGMYVITFDFQNKDNYWNRLKEHRNERKNLLLEEKLLNKKEKIYGEYKQTKTYRPF